jgi:XTP/dITP diphosphohydrolase
LPSFEAANKEKMTKLIFASHNQNKILEIRELLPNLSVLSLDDLGFLEEIPETGSSLSENAIIKAQTIFNAFGKPVFADDTGLIVPALNGDPGVYSARYAGPECKAEANMDKLLRNLQNSEKREAYFETSICYIDQKGNQHLFKGQVEGRILKGRQGEHGFGYDPIFSPNGHAISFAEMSSASKNKMSHRGRALQALIQFLQLHA